MLMGLNTQPPSFGRRAPVWITSVGGIITYNPLVYRGVPVSILLSGTGLTLVTTCKLPPGTHVLNMVQDGTGNRTVTTYPADWRFVGSVTPALSTGANKIDVLTAESDGVYTLVTASFSF